MRIASENNPILVAAADNGGFVLASAPVLSGETGSLVTSAGTWTFGTATNAYGNAILLNDQTTGVGWGTEIEVANGNQLYADNPGGWYQWTGSGWAGTAAPSTTTTALATEIDSAGHSAAT